MTAEQYISKYYPLAVEEMNRFKIPASITLAQGLIETESGNSILVTKANNHFGIKCKTEWTGPTHIHDDDKKNECFRAYASAEESFRDHSNFLLKPRYSSLFGYEMSDYRSWAFGLKQAGYATNPKYPAMLIKFIEDYKLYEFDKFGLEKTPEPEKPKEIIKPQLSKEEIIKQRKSLANNIELILVDENFDIYKIASSTKLSIASLMEFNDIEGEQQLRLGQNFFLQKKGKMNAKEKHTVLIGESLYDISQIYGVSLKQLRKYNKLEPWEQPLIGEYIYLNRLRDDLVKSRPFYLVDKERKEGNLNLFIPLQDSAIQITNNVLVPNAMETKNPTPTPYPMAVEPEKPKAKVTSMEIENPSPPVQIIEATQPVIKIKESKVWIGHIVKPKETIFRISKIYQVTPSDILSWNNLNIEQGLKIGQELRIQTSFPNGLNVDAPANEEILPVKSYEPEKEEIKPKAIIVKPPLPKAIDSNKLSKTIPKANPPIKVEKTKMSDLYKSVKKDSTKKDTIIKQRIKLIVD
jgi:LysM repeat protein